MKLVISLAVFGIIGKILFKYLVTLIIFYIRVKKIIPKGNYFCDDDDAFDGLKYQVRSSWWKEASNLLEWQWYIKWNEKLNHKPSFDIDIIRIANQQNYVIVFLRF